MQLQRRKYRILFGISLAASYAFAQEPLVPAAANRPKIGLVLEGGGALGLAHVGVIQWLEEHRIPVSYVAGTSMGGLIGGVYATGRSAPEIREVVQGINWDEVLRGQTPYQDLSFRRKEDAREYPSTLEFGLRGGLRFPAGFNSGQQVSLIVDRIALPYSELKSFDDLPIPFACVATDLVSRKQHVFRSGPLALALRSTMSLPGIFTPVVSGDHVYADGGLLNNIPIGVVKEMGADILLGVHLEVAPLNPKETLSSFGVMGQSISVMIAANELRSMEQADLLVSVPLQKYSSTDYKDGDAIIQAGYDAAAAKAKVLSTFSVSEVEWQEYLANRNARRREAAPVPEFVQVTGVPADLSRSIENDMSTEVGQRIDFAKLNDDILRLAGTGPYSSLTYWMTQRDGQQGLHIQADPKPYAPPIVRPLILIDGSDYNEVLFSIGARITFFNFGGYRREWRSDVTVGSQYSLNSEYYRPFTPLSNWFVAPRVGLDSTQYPLYSGNDLIALYRRREAGGGLDVGYQFGRTGELRLGYEGGYERLSPQIGFSTVLPTVSGTTGDVRMQYILNRLDDPVIPRAGQALQFYTKWFNTNPASPGGFPLSEIQSRNFFRLSDPSSVFLNAYGGTSYGYKTGIPAFSLGGSQRLVAYGTNELLTNQYFLFQLGYIRRLANLPPLLGDTVNLLAMYEVGKTYQLPIGPKPPNLPMDGAVALIVNTIFGPVEVGGAVGNYGHGKFFFRVGRLF
jgi:NTE family protein